MARRAKSKSKAVKRQEEEMSTSSSEHEFVRDENVLEDHEEQGSNDDDSSADGEDSGSDEDEGQFMKDSGESTENASSDDNDESSEENSESNDEDNEDVAPETADEGLPLAKEQCTFSLRDLLSFNTHQINSIELHSSKKPSLATSEWYHSACISGSLHVNEDILMEKAISGTSQILKELWKLPSEKVEGGLMVAKLPSGDSGSVKFVLPRALPLPPQKQLTKWEKFALQRGISPKSKRSRKQFDEATGTWKHLTGSLQNKANAGPESWPILEVKKNDDPMQDPWEKLREEKKGRINKNTESRMRNAERSGLLEKGGANRMAKNLKKMEKKRQLSRENERQNGLVAPVGVPVDMIQSGEGENNAKRGKPSIQHALKATQVSTASLGRFDKMREGEPERQLDKHGKKRKQLVTDGSNAKKKAAISIEAQKSREILSKVMNGSKEKEKDVRKGKYATGETAYDYEFDDGLGSGTFKKKKGRAGVGKMRKVTKKRMK
ncbi:hypothetical protein HJC23_002691 [Cyclotella cryptica]|uniref:Ribosome biogenesis regulatory protein n=1 Tax=Cyclotella cryptica TaxID=29204 RepID=A0ABD3NGB8_9STRA